MDITQEQAAEMKSRSLAEELGIRDNSAEIAEKVKQDRKAAKLGDPHAQYCMGVHYQTGVGVPFNPKKAAYWYEKAAAQGNKQAQKAIAERKQTNKE